MYVWSAILGGGHSVKEKKRALEIPYNKGQLLSSGCSYVFPCLYFHIIGISDLTLVKLPLNVVSLLEWLHAHTDQCLQSTRKKLKVWQTLQSTLCKQWVCPCYFLQNVCQTANILALNMSQTQTYLQLFLTASQSWLVHQCQVLGQDLGRKLAVLQLLNLECQDVDSPVK